MGDKRWCLLSYLLVLCIVILVGCSAQMKGVFIENNKIEENNEGSKQVDKRLAYALTVDTNKIKFKLNPRLYGLFFEDINKAADGGLNAELVENKSFEQIKNGDETLYAWQVIGDQNNSYTLENKDGIHLNNPSYLKLNLKEKIVLNNIGHNGIPMKKGENYTFSLWLRNDTFVGNITACVEGGSGKKLSDEAIIQGQVVKNGEWSKYTAQIKGIEKGIGNLIITFEGSGIINVDFISLMPQVTWRGKDVDKWPYGGLRIDLVEALQELSPGFIRFPGGCIVEGDGLDNTYNWKDTIGPLEERKEQKNLWGYWQSYGLGYHEYFQLCEDLGAEPIPVVHAGMTCQIRKPGEYYVPKSEAFEESIQNAIDLIEYANGDSTTYWGQKRVQNGHIEPFNLKYIAIGNENWGAQYWENFDIFKERIQEKYKNITVITSSGPWASGPEYDMAWEEINEKHKETFVDEHFYMTPEWFLGNTDRYDYYNREGAKVFIGEYAAHNGKANLQAPASGNTLYAALAEAAFMTGIEKNGDVVKMASYAPLFAKQGSTQWPYNMIWFDHYNIVYTPNYYVQQLFSKNLGDTLLESNLEKENEGLQDISGGIMLGGWSTAVAYDEVQVISNKDGKIIFEDDFEDNIIDPIWKIKDGVWKEEEGVLKQISTTDGEKTIYIDGVEWSDYTVNVKVKKVSGMEGFLIGVGVTGPDDFIWYNAGGWGNTKDAVERSCAGTKAGIGFTKKGTFLPIKTNADYTIDICYTNEQLKVIKNDVVIQEVAIKALQKDLYTSVTQDSQTKETFVKLVNTTEKPIELILKFEDKSFEGKQKMITLAHDNPQVINSFKCPNAIMPIEQEIAIQQNQSIIIPAYSVNVIKLSKNE